MTKRKIDRRPTVTVTTRQGKFRVIREYFVEKKLDLLFMNLNGKLFPKKDTEDAIFAGIVGPGRHPESYGAGAPFVKMVGR